MAKKKKKKALRLKKFDMPSIKKIFRTLEKRRNIADEVVAALAKGGVGKKFPFQGTLSDVDAAKRVSDNLHAAVNALSLTCPNTLDSRFTVDIGSSWARNKKAR